MGGEPTVIQPAPTTPAPSATDSAKGIYEAQLQYGKPMAQQEFDIQREYVPKQAALYQSLYNQYYPEVARQQQATQQELYPYQSQIVEQGAQQALSRLQNPDYMTPQEQQALDYQRGQQINEMQRAMRERANLGGGLYGGRAAGAEARSMQDLLGQFETQDYSRRMQAGAAAQQQLNPYMQILYPQVGTQTPQFSPYQYQSAVPQADTLYNAMFQASQPQYFASQGDNGSGWFGLGGSALGAGGMLGAASILASSARYTTNIKLWA
jgi:hypothetical protein